MSKNNSKRAVIVSATRTPVGRYLGSLSALEAAELGAIVIKEAVSRAQVDAQAVDEVIMGHAVQGRCWTGSGQAGGYPSGTPRRDTRRYD